MREEKYLIGICDNDKNYLEELTHLAHRICMDEGTPALIKKFNSGEAVIGCSEQLDILILDEELADDVHQINGSDVRRNFAERSSGTLIICVSAYEHYMKESFGPNVMGFVTKGSEDAGIRLQRIFRECLDKVEGDSKVAYIEADQHNVQVHLFNDEVRQIRGTIENLAEGIKNKKTYIRCHRSYIVNLMYVDKVIGKFSEFSMRDGTIIPIARSQRNEAEEKYTDFKEEKIRILFGNKE